MAVNFKEEIREELRRARIVEREHSLVPSYRVDPVSILKGGKHLLDFSSFDVFGLARHPRILSSAQSAVERRGVCSASSRLGSGTSPEHAYLEDLIARSLNVERVILFPTKSQAVLSLVAATLCESDLLISDPLISSPTSDAAHLVNSELVSIDPTNRAAIPVELEHARGFRRAIFLCEEFRSYDGAWVDIDPLSSLMSQLQIPLFVDYSFRLAGLTPGAAFPSSPALIKIPPFGVFGDLSAIGGFGGFIGGPSVLIDLIISRSNSLHYDPALPPGLAGAAAEAIAFSAGLVIERSALIRRCEMAFELLKRYTLFPLSLSPSPIVSLRYNSFRTAAAIQHRLSERGFLLEALRPRSAGSATGVLRFVISALHSDKQIEALVSSLVDLTRVVVGESPS